MKFPEVHAFHIHNSEFIPKGSSFGSHILFKDIHLQLLLQQTSLKELTQCPTVTGRYKSTGNIWFDLLLYSTVQTALSPQGTIIL